MKAKFKFYPENNLLVEAFYGRLTLNDLELINAHQSKHTHFNNINKTYSDIRQCQIDISLEELSQYIAGLKELMTNISLRWAIVTNHPNTTALSMIIKSDSFFDKRVQIYSTNTAALSFLGVEMNPNKLLDKDFSTVE